MTRLRIRPMLWWLLAMLLLTPMAVLVWQLGADAGSEQPSPPVADASEQLKRGQYLARAGNCMGCHTVRGGADYAGGRGIPTPFGELFSPNITPDAETGIGRWSADDFWRAMHNGRGRNGEFLYPAFPYPNYTRVTRADADAIHAWLRTVPAVHSPRKEHMLRFPYNQRWLLAGWRALYFRPGVYQADPARAPDWNRGAYLVQGLGHCNACHSTRNQFGATKLSGELTGGLIPMLNWYAPSLASSAEGLGEWSSQDLVALLATGVSDRGAVFGPMAEVVRESLQHLSHADIRAMADYMKSLPQVAPAAPAAPAIARPEQRDATLKLGAALYEKQCAQCHQVDGRGQPPAFPPLVATGAVMTPSPVNAIRMVLNGGYPPSTSGNPRPFGMPPYGPFMSDAEVAAVVSYVRTSWGNKGAVVSAAEVARARTVPVE